MAPSVCECLLGDPSSRSTTEWRWGRKGSFRLRLDSGTWNDFESGEGGGVLALVMREERCDKAAALEWLQQHGFLRPRVAYAPQTGNSAKFALSQSTNRATNQRRSTRPPEQERRDTLRWIRSQVLPIADAKDHPVRAWLARRNLWRPELPLPPSLRWIPRILLCSDERTPDLEQSRFRWLRLDRGERPILTFRHPPPSSLCASTKTASRPTIRTLKAIGLISPSSAMPGWLYGP